MQPANTIALQKWWENFAQLVISYLRYGTLTSEVKGVGEGTGVDMDMDTAAGGEASEDVDMAAGGEDRAEVNLDDADKGDALALERVLEPGPITCGN